MFLGIILANCVEVILYGSNSAILLIEFHSHGH